MSKYKVNIGDVELISLTDGHGSGEATEIFPTSNLGVWESEYKDLLDGKLIHPRFGSFVISINGRLIVVDTGMNGPEGQLLRDMKAKGIDPNEIELVINTHLHPDHVGWNLSNGKPTFSNARYLIPKHDWEYWTSPEVINDAPWITDSVVSLNDERILDLIEGEYDVTPEIKTIPTPGHTPGHISISITSNGHHGFILGDVAHSPIQAKYTDWSPAFDVDPDLARFTRNKIFDRLEAENTLIASGHFPEPGFGRLKRANGRRYWFIE
jgi:glyoxylase-like metal-dependent hydrolase (beta-lactamase superfamily II)